MGLLRSAAASDGGAVAEDLPSDYARRTSPVAGDASAVARGRGLFVENCATCHGEGADGRGPAAVGLKPPPANLSGGPIVSSHSDAYLFYRVTTGKRGSAMPSFQGALSEEERWTIVAYLRSLAGGR